MSFSDAFKKCNSYLFRKWAIFYLFSIITQLYTNYNNLLTLSIFKGLWAAYRSHFILLMSISLNIATHTLKALMLFF